MKGDGFTQGTWEVGELRVGVSNSRAVVNTNKGARTLHICDAHGCTQEEADANALVIAVAPKMYEFIEEIAAWECDCDMPEPGENGIVECWACRAKKLLAKARGEA